MIKNLHTDKQIEIDVDDVTVISWSDDNKYIFLGTEHGHVVGYRFDHQLFK
jgi:hypothetical protein